MGHKGRRTYSLNEQSFATVTDESAYWIGFLLADGNVYVRPPGSPHGANHSINLSLQADDRAHLEQFRSFLNSSHPIREAETRDRRTGAVTRSVRINISSRSLASDLSRYGVVPRKSLVAIPPPELAESVPFWRGVLDGDGCLSWVVTTDPKRGYRYTRPLVSLYGSRATCEAFAKFVSLRFPAVSPRVKPHRSIWLVRVSGLVAAGVAGELYADTPALGRKADLAREFARSYRTKPPPARSVRRAARAHPKTPPSGAPSGCSWVAAQAS